MVLVYREEQFRRIIYSRGRVQYLNSDDALRGIEVRHHAFVDLLRVFNRGSSKADVENIPSRTVADFHDSDPSSVPTQYRET